ncbi:MAG: protein kinase [Archangiaceae bacterium]|nr:protein kinase [Archangiaceae bacterium]
MRKPTIFGKYLLLERVNVGGMAEVFIAKAFGVEGFERILAIKKILPTMAEDEEFITMFIDEARISVQLNHANIVHIHELGKHDDAYFIAMEYVSGRDLRTILERYRRRKEIMPTAQAVYVASKICEGLDYAHRKKDARGQELSIIHRDVSPQNILCSYEGEVKIIDFGIAKAANRSQKTQAGILKGKFGYMSPEQVRGLPIDRRSDVFAVGVILYEMLTGEKLFVGESDFSTLEKVRNAEVASPRQFNPNIPAGLEKVVLKALTREAEDRYQWASDLQEDLMRFLLAGDAIYSAKHLSQFMKEAFAEDLMRETEKMERFANIDRPEQIESSGITATHDKGRKRAPSPAVTAPALTGNPTSTLRPSRGSPTVSAASGNGAVATGLQNASVSVPPPSADELADMDGPGDRTQIVDADMKTMIGNLPTVGSTDSASLATDAVTGNAPVTSAGRDQPPVDLDKTMAPQPVRRMRASAAHQRPTQLEPANGRTSEQAAPFDTTSELNSSNDLRPLEKTGFVPANLKRAGEDVDDITGTASVKPEPPQRTKSPSGGNRPKIVIGDAVQYSGATVVGPSPLARPAEDVDGEPPGGDTRVMKANADDDDGRSDDPAASGDEEPYDRTDGEADALEEDPTGSEIDPEVDLPTSARPSLNKRAMTAQQKKVAIIGGGVTVLLIAVLAVVAVMMLGSNPGQLYVRIAAPDGTPGGQFSVKVTPPGKTYDGEKAISLDPGDYTIEVIPSSKGLESARQPVHIGAGETRPLLIKLKPVGPSRPEPSPRAAEPAKTADARPPEGKSGEKVAPAKPAEAGKPGEPTKAEPAPKAAEPAKAAEGKPAETKPAEAKPPAAATSYTVAFNSEEAGVEVLLDGKRVGKTPDLKVPGLAFDKQHKVVASKPGFRTINLLIDNPNKLETLEQGLTMVREEGPAPKETKPVAEKPKDPPKEAAKPAEKPAPAPKKEEPPKEAAKPVEKAPAPKKEEPPKKEEAPKETAAAAQPAKKGGKAAKGKFACATKPLGAEVWVDGKNTGEKTPISLSKAIELPLGKHKVTFKLNGKTIGPFDIDVTEEEVAKLTGKTFD